MNDDILLYDWLSFSVKVFEPDYILTLIGMDHVNNWQVIKGARGYRDRLYYDGISVNYNGADNMGSYCEMSGQGCRTWETISSLHCDWPDLFERLMSADAHLTRLDVAFDDHSGVFDIADIANDVRRQEYISKTNYWEVIESSKGVTVQLGAPASKILLRIYDKARERKCEPGVHWNRVELQMRDERANAFVGLRDSIGRSFSGVLRNYVRFVDPSGDTNKSRWPTKPYWARLIDGAERISLYTAPGSEYNFLQLEQTVINHMGNAVEAYLTITGMELFCQNLASRSTRRNPKYTRIIDEYMQGIESD